MIYILFKPNELPDPRSPTSDRSSFVKTLHSRQNYFRTSDLYELGLDITRLIMYIHRYPDLVTIVRSSVGEVCADGHVPRSGHTGQTKIKIEYAVGYCNYYLKLDNTDCAHLHVVKPIFNEYNIISYPIEYKLYDTPTNVALRFHTSAVVAGTSENFTLPTHTIDGYIAIQYIELIWELFNYLRSHVPTNWGIDDVVVEDIKNRYSFASETAQAMLPGAIYAPHVPSIMTP